MINEYLEYIQLGESAKSIWKLRLLKAKISALHSVCINICDKDIPSSYYHKRCYNQCDERKRKAIEKLKQQTMK